MLSKRAKTYDPGQEPPDKRFRSNVGDLLTNNAISGRRGAELLRDAEAAGAAGLQFVHRSSAESAGATGKNAARFIRNSFTKRTAWPQEYRAEIRARKRRGQLGETRSWMSFWLPHELLRALHRFGDAEVLADRRGLDKVSLARMASVDGQMDGAKSIPLGFWQDGAPVNWDRTVSLEIFTMSLPGQSGEWRNLRLPLTALLKRQIGERTMDDICAVIAWSFRRLAPGKHPPSRHDNKAWLTSDKKRKSKVGQALPCHAVLAQMRGDWTMFEELFKLPRWGEKEGCCFR